MLVALVNFNLRGAHPLFAAEIEKTLHKLCTQYPFAPLHSVSLYEPRGHDTSMGATYPGGKILLNAYWFAGDPDRLNDASQRNYMVEANGVRLGWHGQMIKQPQQVLHHEFFHVVNQAAPKLIDPWAEERWLAATRNPYLAPSGYSLGGEPAEWFAEAGALYSLGLASEEDAEDMYNLLRRI